MPRLNVQPMRSSVAFSGNSVLQRITPADPNALKVGAVNDFTIGGWVKLRKKTNTGNNDAHTLAIADFNFANDKGYLFQVTASSGAMSAYVGATSYTSAQGFVPYGEYVFLVYRLVGQTYSFFVNGVKMIDLATKPRVLDNGGVNCYFGSEGGGTGTAERRIDGFMGLCFSAKAGWTDQQILDAMNGKYPTTAILYDLDEGAGNTALDRSGNANNGVIQADSYSADVPTRTRFRADDNIIFNGNFEYIPSFVAPTTANAVWLNGRANGSTENIFGWRTGVKTGVSAAQFDTTVKRSGAASLKITATPNSNNSVLNADTQGPAAVKRTAQPIAPGALYSIAGFVKTEFTGDTSRGAYIRVEQFDGNGISVASTDTGYFKGITDWTSINSNQTIRMNSAARYAVVSCNVHGILGNLTLDGAAWFDDIELKETEYIGKKAVQDLKSALSLDGASYATVPGFTPGNVFSFAAWVKILGVGSFPRVFDWVDSGGQTGYRFLINSGNNRFSFMTGYGTGRTEPNGNYRIWEKGVWYHVAGTFDGTNVKVFADGKEEVSAVLGGAYAPATGQVFTIGAASSTLANKAHMIISNIAMRNGTVFSSQEIVAHMQGKMPAGATVVLPANDGAGQTLFDKSGNNLHATLVGGVFVKDTPTQARKLVGANMLDNGNFEYAPPFTAPTTTQSRYVDGTAGGSLTNNLFSWVRGGTDAGTSSLQFDSVDKFSGNYSLKLINTSTGNVRALLIPATNYGAVTPAQARDLLPRCQPNTSYTMTFRVKTSSLIGNFQAAIGYVSAAGGAITGPVNSPQLTATNVDWTQYSMTVVTNSTAFALCPQFEIFANTGIANIDDIMLVPTANIMRT